MEITSEAAYSVITTRHMTLECTGVQVRQVALVLEFIVGILL